jgi:outer membrane lipoprotein-sorting protein
MAMKRLTTWALLGFIAASAVAAEPSPAPPLTATQIVERNAAARGGLEAWRRVESMAWTGRVESASRGGHKLPFLLEQKRPHRTRFEVTVDGQKAIRVFDGSQGWKVRAGSAGSPDVRPYTAGELRFARGAPLIEGPLMDLAAQGAAMTLAGVQEIAGRTAYALSLRLPSGSSCRVWVDAETFLELRYDRELLDATGRAVVTSVFFADYHAFEGLQVPLTVETGTPDGTARDRLVIEQVALNPRLDDGRFARPASPGPRGRGVTVDTRSAAQGEPARRAP